MKKFDNFSSNLNVLKCAEKENLENEFIISGVIDKFILQFELSWKVLKLCLKYEGKGVANSGSPREILKAAYSTYEFLDEKIWLEMLKARNDMSHIYDGNVAPPAFFKVRGADSYLYFPKISYIFSNCSSISFTSLNCVLARTRLCSG